MTSVLSASDETRDYSDQSVKLTGFDKMDIIHCRSDCVKGCFYGDEA